LQKTYVIVALFIVLISGIVVSCNHSESQGEKLAKTHCASCHVFPDPSLLDKKSWTEGVLPQMAELMNVDAYYNPYTTSGPDGDQNVTRVRPDNLFPNEKFQKIYQYYLTTAPEKAIERKDNLPPIITGLKDFKVHVISNKFQKPLTTFVQIDTAAKELFFADANAGKLFSLNQQCNIIDSANVVKGTVAMLNTNIGMQVLSMGILSPSDAKLGKLNLINKNKSDSTLLDSLQRPVYVSYADLNNDKKQDMVISEFGFRRGALCWFENTGNGKFEKHVLRALPGAICTGIYDFNKDGKPDIIALMAQADEGVFIYYNEGNGKFREEAVVRFPPVYGSCDFQLLDYNHDGAMDFLTTNGDNADYSISLKAYHGIRVFLNDGNNKFKEAVFLPVNGIQKAIPLDFDRDGDMDIVSIAFFPDYKNRPAESFIYWENKGNNAYNRYSFQEANDGRWMTMDAGDMDGDGDTDIILGSASFSFGEVPQQYKDTWSKKAVSVIILENTLIVKK
jgi:FG-GAP-like repeat